MIPKLGFALVNQKHLEHSMSVQTLKFEEAKNGSGFFIENRYYKIHLAKDGSIHSWKDKRTKNFEREICKSDNRLNKLSIHQDVPFFWDAWDIMLHSFETVTELLAVSFNVVEVNKS